MRGDQRQSLLKSLFEELVMRDGAIESAKPKADWLPFLEERFTSGPAWGLVGIDRVDGQVHLRLQNGTIKRAA